MMLSGVTANIEVALASAFNPKTRASERTELSKPTDQPGEGQSCSSLPSLLVRKRLGSFTQDSGAEASAIIERNVFDNTLNETQSIVFLSPLSAIAQSSWS